MSLEIERDVSEVSSLEGFTEQPMEEAEQPEFDPEIIHVHSDDQR
jgi:hypothetical protein